MLPELLGQLRTERDRPLPRLRLRRVLGAAHECLTDPENGPGGIGELDVPPKRRPSTSPRRSPTPTTVRKTRRACSLHGWSSLISRKARCASDFDSAEDRPSADDVWLVLTR